MQEEIVNTQKNHEKNIRECAVHRDIPKKPIFFKFPLDELPNLWYTIL